MLFIELLVFLDIFGHMLLLLHEVVHLLVDRGQLLLLQLDLLLELLVFLLEVLDNFLELFEGNAVLVIELEEFRHRGLLLGVLVRILDIIGGRLTLDLSQQMSNRASHATQEANGELRR